MHDALLRNIETLLATCPGQTAGIAACRAVSGGDAARAMRLTLDDGREVFCKYIPAGQAGSAGPFRAEALALERLGDAAAFVLPRVLACNDELLLLSWLEFAPLRPADHAGFGRALARLHLGQGCARYGFDQDNWLGAAPQTNAWHDDWTGFWQAQRLLPQLRVLADRLGADDRLIRAGETLLGQLPAMLDGVDRRPVLLHGDLWSGNMGRTATGQPVILDPASYYGDREAEFGMLRLFGGLSPAYEAAYNEIWPLEPGFSERVLLYRLYHEMNHLRIFGNSYYDCSLATLRTLLKQGAG